MQPLICEVFETRDGVGSSTIPLPEGSLTLCHHLFTAFASGVPWRVCDQDAPTSFHASQRFTDGRLIVFCIVERGVEDDHLKLPIGERKTRHLGLESWKESVKMLLEMRGCAESVLIIHQQVHRHAGIAFTRKSITHPSVSRAKVKHLGRVLFVLKVPGQQFFSEMVECASSDIPLPDVSSGYVLVRKVDIELRLQAAASFRSPNILILLDKAGEVCEPLWYQRLPNTILGVHRVITM